MKQKIMKEKIIKLKRMKVREVEKVIGKQEKKVSEEMKKNFELKLKIYRIQGMKKIIEMIEELWMSKGKIMQEI